MPKNLRTLATFFLIMAAAVLAAGCSDSEVNGQTSAGRPPATVTAQTIEPRDLPLAYEYPAQVDGSREVEVRAQVGGILLKRTYEEGSYVREGDVLFRIAPETYDANLVKAQGDLEQLKAQLELARLDKERKVKLHTEGVVSTQERDDAVSAYEAAKAAVKAAEGSLRQANINLGYTEVTAPISGITSKETRSEGSLVTVGTETSLLTTITCLDPVYVNFSIPGTEVLKMRRMVKEGRVTEDEGGLTVRLELADGSLYEQAGHINYMAKQEDPQTGAVRVRAEVPNPDGLIMPGGFVRAIVGGRTLAGALLVPQRAVLFSARADIVYTLDAENTASPRPVKLGISVGDEFEVLDGLKPGERIVVDGTIKVTPGGKVNPVTAEAKPAAQTAGGAK
ncbi:efflux RND transporter periplasmic adaptor subunit [Desulfocurvus sp. DL9XJH121]